MGIKTNNLEITGGGITLNGVSIFDKIYPVGSLYLSVTNTNPGTLFGGTWISWGAGRVPLAIGNNGETNYTSPEQTGGSENSVATHTHEQNAHNHTQDAHHHNLRSTNSYSQDVIGYGYGAESQGVGGTKTNASVYWYEKDRSNNVLVSDSQPYIHSTTAVNKDTGVSGGNRMPFITCYMWKRTA